MNRPDDVADDVWERALNYWRLDGCSAALPNNYAAAILQERERCKKIAALFIHNRLYKPHFPACSYHARDVMAAMDSVSEPELAGYADDLTAVLKVEPHD